MVTVDGTLTSVDVDNIDNLFIAQSSTLGSKGYGNFTLNADGTWSYQNNLTPFSPESNTDSFVALSADGTEQIVTVSQFAGSQSQLIQYTVGQLSMVLTDSLGWSNARSTDYGFTPLSNIAGANGQLEIDANGFWLYTLSALPSPSGGVLTDTFRVAFNYQFSDPGSETETGYVNLTVNIDSSSEPGRLIYSSAAAYSADSPPSLASNFELLAVTTLNNSLSSTTDHINLLAQGVLSGLTEVNSSEPGNIGVLTTDNFGRYTYSINQVSVDSVGHYASTTPLRYDTLVLTHFTNLFYQDLDHTDTFNVTTTNGSSTVDVNIGNTIIGMVINDMPGGIDYSSMMNITENLGLAAGSQNVQIISGADPSNFYINNIGSLSLNLDGTFSYTITSAAISAWELNNSHLGYASDLFLVSSTVGNTINIQALEFSIIQESDTTVMNNSSSVESGRNEEADIYLFNTWDSIYSSPSTPHSHTINNFETDYDRINISRLLTSPDDLLSGKIYIDPLNESNSRSEIHVNHLGSDYVIANISGRQASIPELMWNEAWNETSNFAPVTSLNAVTSWTETLEITGVTSYDEAQKTFSVSLPLGVWTMQIVSSDEISISSSGANRTLSFGDKAGEVVFSQIVNGETYTFHDISHVDKINWQVAV
jgi:VCBS repeat-containing protein